MARWVVTTLTVDEENDAGFVGNHEYDRKMIYASIMFLYVQPENCLTEQFIEI